MKKFKQDFPLTRPHCGIPLANGTMGVLVWGKDNCLSLTVNRSDLWDHRQGECVIPGQTYKELVDLYDPDDVEPINQRLVTQKFPYELDTVGISWRPTRLPVGRLDLELKKQNQLTKAVLEYESGILRIKAGKSEIRLLQSLEKPQLLLEDPDKIIKKVTCHPAWPWAKERWEKVGYVPPQMFEAKNKCGWFQPCPEDPGINVCCRKTAYGRAVIMEMGTEPVMDSKAEDFSTAAEVAANWWKNYWKDCPSIRIPDVFLNKFYKFAVYKFACATHPDGIACGLQGPWHEEYQRAQWSGDYHFNVNVQQVYTLAFSTGKFEHLMPLFDMLESEPFQKVMRENARNLFGIDDGLLMTHAVDDRGMQCGWMGAGAVLDFACGGWTAQLYWLYYKYTHDTDFLQKRALPFIRGVMRVFEETLEERDGKLSIPLSISAEYGCTFKVKKNGRYVSQNTGRDPSYQLACMHMLADFLLEACEVTGEQPEAIWLDIKKRLPKYTLISETDEPHIAIWEDQDLDVCHRHHSHLACIYPFETLTDPTPEEAEIIENSIDHWILRGMGQWSEWCYPWAIIIHARLGFTESPLILFNIWKEIYLNEGLATVYLPRTRGITAHRRKDLLKPKETTEIMQLDGTMGGATALLEMLAHQHGDTVYLFKGIPEKWQDVSFKNIHLPNGFTVSAKRGQSVTVTSRFGGKLKVKFDNHTVNCNFEPDEEKTFEYQ